VHSLGLPPFLLDLFLHSLISSLLTVLHFLSRSALGQSLGMSSLRDAMAAFSEEEEEEEEDMGT
jgi:hypothetical protein